MWKVDKGTLQIDGKAVEQITSKNTSGKFAKTPKIIVIHYTAGSSARSSANWFSNPQNRNSSAHVVIERDGTILQCVNFEKVAWHAGRSSWHGIVGLNRHSIGIEIANFGPLRSSGGCWQTYTGKAIADPFMGVHRNGNPDGSRKPIGWEPFPEEQFEAVRQLCEVLRDTYDITEIVGHDDIAPVRKSDPGPAFNMTRLRTCVLDARKDEEDNLATVSSASGLNMRTGPGTNFDKIVTLKDKTKLQLLGQDGVWLQVTALDSSGVPQQTGWVHSHYVKMD